MKRSIPDEVLAVLSAGRCEGQRFYLPTGQLDRKLYTATDKVIGALGGLWNKGAKAHLFAVECEPLIESAIETGEYSKPADMGWFPTPDVLAKNLVGLAEVQAGMHVLEPSAGEGAIAHHLLCRGASVVMVELDPGRAQLLRGMGGDRIVVETDFLGLTPEPIFDRVVANPPFAKRADIHHVRHAYKFLKPGGMLVSIMSAGVMFREDALAVSFRNECDDIQALPDDSFASSGTHVRTCVVTMRKPA